MLGRRKQKLSCLILYQRMRIYSFGKEGANLGNPEAEEILGQSGGNFFFKGADNQ